MSKICKQCNVEIEEGRNFCPKCGQAVISKDVEDENYGNGIDEEHKFVRKRNEIIRGVPWAVDTTLVNLKQNLMKIKKERRILSLFNQTQIDTTAKMEDVKTIIVKKTLIVSRLILVLLIVVLVIIFGMEKPLRALLALAYATYLFSGRYYYKMDIYTKGDKLTIPCEVRGKNAVEAMVQSICKVNKDVAVKFDS